MDHHPSQHAREASDLIELVDEPAQQAPGSDPVVQNDHGCMTCGYSLRGLAQSTKCPECGTPVADSLRGDLLFYRNTDYIHTLKKGLSLILNGILVQLIVTIFGGIGIAMLSAAAVATVPPFVMDFVIPGVGTAVSAVILLGWWWFTAQDPGVANQDEPKARLVVRGAVIASLVIAIAALLVPFLPSSPSQFGAREAIAIVLGIGSTAAFATQFFAGMLYVRGMARRLPNEKIYKRAKSRMIACPIWYTVGILLIGLGPLIALVLYWNLLNMVSTALKTIIKAQQAGATQPPVIHIK